MIIVIIVLNNFNSHIQTEMSESLYIEIFKVYTRLCTIPNLRHHV